MKRNAGSARAITFVEHLTHTSGPFAGQPFNPRPWQKRIIASLFETGSNGFRKRRTCLLMLPRKNGKSELSAALCLYALLGDGEASAMVVSAAADREQASIVFNIAARMVRNDPALTALCDVVESQKRIVYRKTGSVYKAISAEAYSKHGGNISFLCYDELHCAPNRDLWDVLSTSMGARSQPVTLAISTAGYDRHSILWELYSHAKKVRENPALDPTFLPIIYEMPDGVDWTDERQWKACNPALGDFRSLEDMRVACARAKEIPAQENTFRRLFCNQWTEQASRWVALPAWDACQAPIDRAALRGRRCFVGLDLSSTTDLTAIVAVFPDEGGGFTVLPQFFVPQDKIRDRARRDRVPYDDWARQGVLVATTAHPTVDYDVVRATLHAWASEFQVEMIGFDPWNATDLYKRLEQDGLVCVPVRQTYAGLSAATKSVEKAILARQLRHDGHPVLRWNLSNVAVESDPAGNLKPSKARSSERIDGVVALIMAVDLLDRHAAADQSYSVMVV